VPLFGACMWQWVPAAIPAVARVARGAVDNRTQLAQVGIGDGRSEKRKKFIFRSALDQIRFRFHTAWVRFGHADCVTGTTGPPPIADPPGGGWRFRDGPIAVVAPLPLAPSIGVVSLDSCQRDPP